MFSFIVSAIKNTVKNASEYVIGENKFTRDRNFSFEQYVSFLCFNKGGSNQADLEDFIEDNFTEEKEPITRQAFSKQRTYINPEVFKDINNEYLSEIGYFNNQNSFLKKLTDLGFMQVMDLILNFLILKKYEMNIK